MTLFEEIVAEILIEDVQIGKVNDAINRTYEVKINYQSDNDKASGERIIQPVAYGLTKAGNPVIRAYQPFGDTQTKVPAWKFFLLSGIQSWKPLFKRVFKSVPSDFNPNGDSTMSVVYNIAKFFNQQQDKINPAPIKASGPVKKQDLKQPEHISVDDNPEVQKLKKLNDKLNNPQYIDINNQRSTKASTNKDGQVTAQSGPVTKSQLNQPEHISVKDNPEVKKMEKLRKQLDNPTYISDIIKNKNFGNNTL